MFQTTYVYSSLMLIMILSGYIYMKRSCGDRNIRTAWFNVDFLLPIICFALLFGVRYDVGNDYESYLEIYDGYSHHSVVRDDLEVGFKLITQLMAESGIHYSFYFSLIAFLQIFLIYYTFRKEGYLFPFLAFMIMSGAFLGWMSVIRQSLVWCLFVYAVPFIKQKKFIPYMLCIAAGYTLHRTALLLLPLYFIFKSGKDLFRNTPLQLSLLFMSLLLSGVSIWSQYLKNIDVILNLIGLGDRYNNVESVLTLDEDYVYGPRTWLIFLLNIILILYSNKVKDTFSSSNIKIYYNLYFIGSCINLLLVGNHALQRPFLFFVNMNIIVFSYLLVYLWKYGGKSILHTAAFLLIIAVQLINFGTTIYLGDQERMKATYHFWWEQT